MLKRILATGLLAAAGVAGIIGAHAADMPSLFPQPAYDEVVPPPRMEFGTGWYLRGDIAGSDEVVPRLLGAIGSSKRDWGYALGAGAGYQFTDYFRADITGDYLGSQKRSAVLDPAGDIGRANLQRWDGLVNGYIDLGNWSGLTPYIGAGVGVAGLRTTGTVTGIDGTRTKFAGRNDYNLAWAAMAGVAYHISPHLLLDVGYRFLDLGSYRAPQSTPAQRALYSGSKTDLNAHEVRVGLRYQID